MNVKRLVPGWVRKNDVSGEPTKNVAFPNRMEFWLFVYRKKNWKCCLFWASVIFFDSSDLRGGCETKRKKITRLSSKTILSARNVRGQMIFSCYLNFPLKLRVQRVYCLRNPSIARGINLIPRLWRDGTSLMLIIGENTPRICRRHFFWFTLLWKYSKRHFFWLTR